MHLCPRACVCDSKGTANSMACLWMDLQESPQLWQGVDQACESPVWRGESPAQHWGDLLFRKVLGREFQLFHSSWSRHCDTIPTFLFVHGGDRALMKYTERKQRKNNLNGSKSLRIPPAQHTATFTTPLPWLIPGSLENSCKSGGKGALPPCSPKQIILLPPQLKSNQCTSEGQILQNLWIVRNLTELRQI